MKYKEGDDKLISAIAHICLLCRERPAGSQNPQTSSSSGPKSPRTLSQDATEDKKLIESSSPPVRRVSVSAASEDLHIGDADAASPSISNSVSSPSSQRRYAKDVLRITLYNLSTPSRLEKEEHTPLAPSSIAISVLHTIFMVRLQQYFDLS